MTLEFRSNPDSCPFPMEEEQIHLLERITEETNPLALWKLKQQYNRVVDLQPQRHRRPLPDPIEHFPPELWLHIFKNVGSGGQDDDESNPIDHLLLASLVSPKWRDAILNTPEIWTEVTVDPASTSLEDELFKLHTAMYLSGGGLLTLRLRRSSYRRWEGENGVHRIISNHAHRIQKIVFEGSWYYPLLADSVNTILLSLGPLPQLRLVYTVKESIQTELSWDDLLSHAPALVSINIMLPLGVLTGDRIESFREISFAESIDEILPHMLKFGSLTSLSSWGRLPTLISIPRRWFEIFGDLEELNYYQMDIRPVLSILQVAVKLTALSINVGSSWPMLATLLQACHLLRSLFSLDIRLDNPSNSNDIAVSGPAGPLTVRNLVIKHSLVGSPDERIIVSGCRHVVDLVDVLHVCTPAVEEFHFHSGLVDYVPSKYVSSMRRLFRLTLGLPELTLIPDDMLIQSKPLVCLNLKIKITLISSFFRGLECPNLRRIVLLADGKFGRWLSSPEVTFDSAALPQLESIEWKNHRVFWQITSLPALRKLILSGWSGMISGPCLHFIMRPHDCPSLEYIEFGVIPEWDLLFMMLERRNHSTRSGVSRITTLVFPKGIPYSLLVPITELLNGRFATGTSYHDLSISRIAELYFDKSITGCISCLLSMHSCRDTGRILSPTTWPLDRLVHPTSPVANPPLSDEMSSWLDGREERKRNWTARHDEQGTLRSHSCFDPMISKRMVVTESTLTGLHFYTPPLSKVETIKVDNGVYSFPESG